MNEELCRRGSDDKEKSETYDSQTPSPILHSPFMFNQVFKEDEVVFGFAFRKHFFYRQTKCVLLDARCNHVLEQSCYRATRLVRVI